MAAIAARVEAGAGAEAEVNDHVLIHKRFLDTSDTILELMAQIIYIYIPTNSTYGFRSHIMMGFTD